MGRERIRECRQYRDINVLRQDFFGACAAQCEIVELLKEKKNLDAADNELLDEQENLYECICDCIQYLLEIKVDHAFCNGLYHEYALVTWEFPEEERRNRENLANEYFEETKNDYLPAEIFHIVNFRRMDDSAIQKSLERYYKLLYRRWSHSKKTAEAVFSVLANAIFSNNQRLYYDLAKQYDMLLNYLEKEDYWNALFFMANAASFCKDRAMVVQCRQLLKNFMEEFVDGEIKKEIQFEQVDVSIDLLENNVQAAICKSEKVIKYLDDPSHQGEEDASAFLLLFLRIACLAYESLFQWKEALQKVERAHALFETFERPERDPHYSFFRLHQGYCFLIKGELDEAYKIFDEILNQGYCRDQQTIYEAEIGMSNIALIEQRYSDALEICRELKDEIPETEDNMLILGNCYMGYLAASTAMEVELKREYFEMYKKSLEIAKKIPNDRLRCLTELIYGEYLLKLGSYDLIKLRKVLKETEGYLARVPNDDAVRKSSKVIRDLLKQKEKLKIRERLTKFCHFRS